MTSADILSEERMSVRPYTFLFILLLFLSAHGQERIQRERTFGEPVFVETHLFAADSDSVSVQIISRIRKDLFTFSKNFDTPGNSFRAHGSISVEILDSAGNSVARNIREVTMMSSDNSIQYLRTKYFQSVSSFLVHPGRYTAIMQIEDTDSKRQHPDIRNPLVIRPFTTSLRSDLIPVHQSGNDSSYECFNLGGDVLFSHNFEFGCVVKNRAPSAVIRYSLERFSPDDEEEKEMVVKDTTVSAAIFPGTRIQLQEQDEAVRLHLVPNGTSTALVIPIRGMKLKQGKYALTVTFPDSSTKSVQFKTRWLEMPLSLTDLDIATIPLQYITTEDEYSALRKGGRSSRIEKFDEFWSKKDPTPETAYNEMMAEFYKRVDIATAAYRTLKEQNGALTDRGKIFILYGKPTTTDRMLKPGDVPREIWKYSSFKKMFVFEDPSRQGNYKLTESK